MIDYKIAVSFDRATQKHHATSNDVPGLDVADMNVERLFAKVAKAAPDLLRAAGKISSGFNLTFQKVDAP